MKFSQQEIDKIKEVSCIEFLLSRGHKPKNSHGKTYKFLAPWRPENNPSVHVYKATNTWADFSDRSGGSVIQLCMKMDGVSFGKALEILMGGKLPDRLIEEWKPLEDPIKILYICNIESSWLIQYLVRRCIPLDIAREYCKQARIEMKDDKGSPYRKTCIAWRNDKNGFDFRNAKTKIGNSPKYITTYNKGHNELYLFEGMFDWLAYVSWAGVPQNATVILLNSIVFISYIDFNLYDAVHYMCDNDKASDSWYGKINHPNKIDHRDVFKPYKDWNEWWVAKKSPTKTLYQQEVSKML